MCDPSPRVAAIRGKRPLVTTLRKETAMLGNRLARCVLRPLETVLLAAALLVSSTSSAQDSKRKEAPRPDFIPADYDDYQHMLTQLGIQKMRRGRDARVPD